MLQSELNALHYVVPLNGVFDEATGRAVVAYRKLAGLQRVASTNTHWELSALGEQLAAAQAEVAAAEELWLALAAEAEALGLTP